MIVVEICQMFGWDYWTYLAQPTGFLDLIHRRLAIDGQKAKAEKEKSAIGHK